MKHYTAESIAEALGTDAADWQWDAGYIKTELEFKDFKTAFSFMSKVADMAEKLGPVSYTHLTLPTTSPV